MRFIKLFFVVLTLLLFSCNHKTEKDVAKDNTKIETIISSYLFTQNNIEENVIDTLLTKTFIRNINGIEMVSNMHEHKANMHIFLNRFPDMTLSFTTSFIQDNHAFVAWTFTGTNTGNFGELMATGKKVNISGISHLYFNENEKINREDIFYNELDLLQQLGYTLNPPITE